MSNNTKVSDLGPQSSGDRESQKVTKPNYKITNQHTYIFPLTGESVTAYVCNTKEKFAFGLSFSHKGEDILWTTHYEGILQLPSKVNKSVTYIYLTAYFEGYHLDIERVLMVSDCTTKF